MTWATGHIPFARAGLLTLAGLLGLAGCTLDSEAELRARVEQYLGLGALVYFDSQSECSAAIFESRQDVIKAPVSVVRSAADGLRLLRAGKVVGFDSPAYSPNAVSEALGDGVVTMGVGYAAYAVAAKPCMSAEMTDQFVATLNDPGAAS